MALAGFSVSKNGTFFIRGKDIDNNLYPYHVVLTTKAEDRRLRRSAKEKLSYTARRDVLKCVLPRVVKRSTCQAVDKTRNMEHPTSRNIPEHPGTSNNYDNYEKICKIEFSKINLNKNKLVAVRNMKIYFGE